MYSQFHSFSCSSASLSSYRNAQTFKGHSSCLTLHRLVCEHASFIPSNFYSLSFWSFPKLLQNYKHILTDKRGVFISPHFVWGWCFWPVWNATISPFCQLIGYGPRLPPPRKAISVGTQNEFIFNSFHKFLRRSAQPIPRKMCKWTILQKLTRDNNHILYKQLPYA